MHDFCLVRQPLFSRAGQLLGYEIRYRDQQDGRLAFAQSVLSGTFDLVRGERPAFLSCTASQLRDGVFSVLDPASAVLLVPNSVDAEPEIVAFLTQYRERGGVIAIDDVQDQPTAADALFPLATWARIDVRNEDVEALVRIGTRVVTAGLKRIADHVYDQSQHDVAVALGCEAFMGAYFSRPEPLPASDLPVSTVAAMRLLGQARDPNISDRVLEDTISVDPVLTFQLLRMVNSASIGARGVSSIGQALRLLGRSVFLRWLAMAIAASRKATSGVDQELVRQAVERGRFLEQFDGQGRDSGTLFLVGLFSLMDAVFRMPLDEILSRVALSDDVREALLDRTGPYADALNFAEAYELGLFEHAGQLASEMGIDPATLGEKYTAAVAWTAETLGALSDAPAGAGAR